MNIAYTFSSETGGTDLLLFQFATRLCEDGYNPAGTVQINQRCKSSGSCDMDLKVLPDGPLIRISQDLGPLSKGCRLDTSALESAIGLVAGHLDRNSECLIVNKFGKHEATGRGFRPLIAQALELDVPTIVGLNRLNQDAFLEFTEGAAEHLEATETALRDWLDSVLPSDHSQRADHVA